MFLLCIGFAAIAGAKRFTAGKAAILVVGLQLFYLALKVLGARFMGFN
jgi:hypothetical protein